MLSGKTGTKGIVGFFRIEMRCLPTASRAHSGPNETCGTFPFSKGRFRKEIFKNDPPPPHVHPKEVGICTRWRGGTMPPKPWDRNVAVGPGCVEKTINDMISCDLAERIRWTRFVVGDDRSQSRLFPDAAR